MKHARSDYDRIQDPAGLIPETEPVFLLRAQDAIAPRIVSAWANEAERLGWDPKMVAAARAQADLMREWQGTHRYKAADAPEGAV